MPILIAALSRATFSLGNDEAHGLARDRTDGRLSLNRVHRAGPQVRRSTSPFLSHDL